MKIFSLIAALMAVFAGALAAQMLSDADIPPRPSSGLSDNGGVLGKDPAARQRIIEIIRDLEARHGYRLFVILERVLISTSPNDLASQLQQEWLPDGGGLVIVFESDTRRLGFGRGLDASEGLVENKAGVPAYELVANISQVLQDAEPEKDPELYVEKLVSGIGENLQGYFARKEAPVDGSRSLKLALITIGALSLLALCGMGLGWLMGRSEKRRFQKRVFPSVAVPERLAAPYGGGGGGHGSFGTGGR
ncbi:TPM domain-containing protein [Akkermansiaceae bacterium]|nr:TPM domain-containing protein [Akkermansiaceae bacterium]